MYFLSQQKVYLSQCFSVHLSFTHAFNTQSVEADSCSADFTSHLHCFLQRHGGMFGLGCSTLPMNYEN
ncbi:hypothetical protein CRENBAI_001865 [Crenichthys baileyi]|uniref:Uncharacterized protein n=1 Tax=Crenichthys baileyi TaxID=28760 RepID=A0AAV9RCM0_9TELE